MFNHNSETKGHGSIRKNKVYGTIGVIALGAIAMFSNNKTVSADEVSSSDPTASQPAAKDSRVAEGTQGASTVTIAPATPTSETPATYTAPASKTTPATVASSASDTTPATVASSASDTTPATAASSASDTTPVTYTAPAAAPAKATETEPVKVDSTDLDNAVEDAKKAGVEVTREADVDRGTATTPQETEQKIAEIKNDYKKQTEEIKSVTEAAKVDTAKYNEAKTQYDTAKAQYDVKKSEYDTAKAKYDYDLAQYHVLKTQYDTAKAQYDRDLTAYNEAKLAYAAAKTQYDVDKEAYDKAKTTYDTDKAAYDIAKAQYDAAKISYDAAKVKYEKDLEKYKEDRVAYNIAKTAYDEAQNKYVEDLAQYNKDKAAYDTAKEAYDTAKATYDTAKTQYDSDLAKYKVDKAAYDVAKTTYDRELAQYQVYKEQYDTAKTQYDRDLGQYQILKAQYDAAKTQYAIDKAAYDQAKAQYTVDKAAYDKAKAQYDAALAKYKADSEQYKRDMEEYTRAMIEAEAKKHQDGYLTEAKSQSLIFKSEPNAIRSIDPSVRQYTKKELDDLVRSWGISPTNPDKTKSTAYSYFNQINSNNAYARLVLEKNKPVDVTYTGLENSSFNGKKISKVVYTYTLKATEFGDGTKMSMYASDDPTVTAWYNDFFTSTNINVKVKFYGEDGELIDPTGSLVSFSSLNRGNGSGAVYKDAIESVRYFNGKLIPISGSSIKIQANNSAYADSSNAEKALGSRWETLEWDTAESDKKWYGAIVGEVTQPEISFNMVSYKSGNVWFAFNSDIKAIGVPIKPVEPVEPKAPTAPVEPKAPTAPVEPVAPTAPVEPKAPTAPVEPKAPTAPVEPKAPTAPVEPKAPTAPVEPKAPTAPVEPKAPKAPVEPKAPTAPVEPKAPTAPVEPKAPTAPVEPKAPTPPTTPAIRTAKYHYNTLKSTIEYGNVVVDYQDKQGNTISPRIVDTPDVRVGTAYDTTDHKTTTITTADGTIYRIDTSATQGNESGQVVKGTTRVVYVYDKVEKPVEKKYGDVTVEYKNKDGVTIAPKVTDTPRSEVGTAYDTTDQRKDTITTVVDGKKYKLDLTATQGAETGKVVEGNTNIVYYYDLVPDTPAKKYGDVTVEYKNKDGVTIAPKVTDTPRSEVGTAYDTTDQRKDTITTVVDGKKYKLDLTATQGAETGKVVEGNTNIVYYYNLVPDTPAKKYGDVTVEYKNKDGVTIAPKVTDTPRSEVGTAYDTTDQRKDTITTVVDGKKYKLDLTATQGAETGKVVEGNTNIVYYYDLVPDTPAKKYGDVTVEYKNKDGVTIAPKVTDTPRSEVGTAYDTTDQRKDTITTVVDGKKYKLDLTATQGAETGKVVEGNTNIVYYYNLVPDTPAKKYGDVTVEYKNKDGVTIAPKVTDTPRSEVGTAYDTTDQRKDTITTVVDGKKYKLDPTATQGAETGKVVEGNTNIVYYYDLVPDTPAKKYGDVTVEYKNKDGVTIAPKVTDTPRSEVGTAYDTTDQRKDTITTVVDGKKYKLDPTATQGAETGKVVEGNTNIVYYYDLVKTPEEYGNVVVDYQDKKGNTIAPRIVDTPTAKVGTAYDTTDHKPVTIVSSNGKTYRIDPTATQGQESGEVVKGTTRVVYVYDEVLGDVTVHYKDENGKVIKDPEKDTTGAPINTLYDTRDHAHKTITTQDGRVYEIIPEKTIGLEQGRIVEGNTDVTYVYKEVFGDVVVHYVDESGKKIKEDVTDTSRGKVGKDYDTTDHKSISIKHGNTVYNIVPEKTKGQERGKVVKGVTEVTYVYKAVQAEPKKLGTNAKGEDVNGKTMLAGSTEVYTINIDNDQYKGTTGLVDQDKQAGLMVVEKYDSKFVTPNLDAVRMTTEDGKVVSGFTTKIYKSVAEAPQKVQDYIKAKGLTIDGEFAVTTSDDPVAYTNNYALKGINLKLIFPTTVKKDIKEASKYENKAYQIDFAGIAETNVVTNNIPKINPKKDIVATVEDGLKDQNSLDGKTVKVGAVYNFELNTSYLPAKRGQSIDKIEVKDTYSPLVEYNGVHKWIANTDILLKDNTKIAKGTDLTRYVNQDIDHQARTVVYSFSSDFLSKISDDSEFQAIGYMQVKQLDYGTVKNTFTEIINNVERDSNTVTLVSPEEYGDVVVHYVDESGKKIKEDVTDTSRGKVGKDYDTTDHKSISIKHGNTVYNIVPEKTKGQERGKVVKGVTEVTYVYKAVQAEPKKLGTNAKGEDVNGKTMLAGSTEVYTINIDNDQYKGTTGLVDQDKQAGLMVVEKYDSKFVTPNLDAVRMTTEDGKVVSGFTTKIYKSVAEAPQKVQDYIKAKGLTIDGEFAVTTSDDPVAYTNNYALKGINLKLIFPTTVKKDIKEASKYENKAYQIDFAGIAETNVVTNNIPKINPKKDIVATVEDGLKDQNSLDGKTVKVGAVYNFELNTSYLPAKRGQSIDKIEVKDTYSPLVEYNGVHKWIANTDILLKDNTKIAKGTDLTRYVNQDIDHQARTVVYSFSSDFLSKISDDSEFQAIGYMQVKQLDYGTVKNTFTEIINNVERDSNTVTLVSPEEYGDVVVHYVDESGKKIKEDVTDTSRGKVGKDYDTTDHKSISIKHGNTVYNIVPEKTKGQERGKVVKGVTEVTYVYKAVQAEPKKLGTNAKGEDVNGKTMLAGSTEVYTINIDNDQYKGTTGLVDQDKQAGLMVVEKYDSKFVTPNLDAVRMTTEDGKVVSGFTTKIYKSVAEAPQKVQDYIKAKGLTIDGEFAVTTSDDPVAYTNNYALKGINLKLIFPTTVKKDIKEASKYENKAYQIDFAGIAETNVVTNNIPKINPKKDIVATVEDGLKDQNSLDGKTVKVGAVYNFELNTSYLPAKRGQSIDKIEVKDTYSPLVEYNGVHKWIANTDILLKDNTKIAKGTDLTRYVNQDIDHQARTVVYSFSSDFLSKISDDSEFQAIGYMQVKQLDYGTVKNTFTEIINNVEHDSNTVTVVTPEKPQTPPEKPQTPPEKPQTPPVVPTTPRTNLPETGEKDHGEATVLGLAMMVSAMSLLGFSKRKEEK